VTVESTVDGAFRQRIERIESLIHTIERSADPATRTAVQELIQAVLDLHGMGLARVCERLGEAGEPGRSLLDDLARDDLVGSLLMLHGLHPLDLESRVQQALDSIRPFLRSHGGEVELVGITDGVVQLRMKGSCQGCPSSSETLRNRIEEAIVAAAPDATGIAVEGVAEPTPAPSSGFISVEQLLSHHGNGAVRPERDVRPLVGPPA
jgi:Fe-S cluster biogenesis protein NfuA